MNRTEYANAIRDLRAIDVDVAAILPADDSSEGLNNIADVLGTSPALIERYVGAAAKISRLAVGDTDITPLKAAYKVRGDLSQDQHIPGLPARTRGGAVIRHNFLVDGEYLFKFSLLARNNLSSTISPDNGSSCANCGTGIPIFSLFPISMTTCARRFSQKRNSCSTALFARIGMFWKS